MAAGRTAWAEVSGHSYSAPPQRWRVAYRLMQAGSGTALLCLCAVIAVLLGGLAVSVHSAGWQGLPAAFRMDWDPRHGHYGIMPMLADSFLLATCATALALPLGLGLMGFLWGESPTVLSRVVRGLIRFMIGIPTVVYGFCAVILLVPLMRGVFAGTGMYLLTTTLVVALLIVPTMVLVLDAALHQQLGRPNTLTLGAAALGLSRRKTFWLIALPSQKRRLVTGVLLAFGRAMGDTMLPLMLSGNAPLLPDSPLSGIRTLAAHISLLTATEISPQVELILYLSGTLLLLISCAVSICAGMGYKKRGRAGAHA